MFKKKEKPAEVKKDLSTSHSRKDSSKSDREDEDSAQLDKLDDKKSDAVPPRKDSSAKDEPNSNGSKSADLSDSYKKREERKRQNSIDQDITTSGDVIIRIDSARSVKDKKKSSKSSDDHATSKSSSRSLLKVEEPIVHIHRDNEEKIEAASELSELDNYPLDQDDDFQLDAAYNYFSNDFIKAVNKLHDISRNANGQIMPPEIVLIGPTSHGKSALLEALIGHHFNALGLGAVTKRPLLLQLQHSAHSAVQWTLKRDTLTPGGADRVLDCKDLAAEIVKRNSKYSKTPIVVRVEGSTVLNMHWIDTPGVPAEESTEYEHVVSVLNEVTRPLHRILLCVEELPHSDWTQLKMHKLMKQLDPDHTRTVFVFTRTQAILREYTALQDINKHLNAVPNDIKPWLISLPATKTRQSLADSSAYRKRLLQAAKRDARTLEQLHGDNKWEQQLGVVTLRIHLNERVVRRYRELVPEVSSQLKHAQGEHDKALATLKHNLTCMSHTTLHTASQNYTVELVHALDKLVAGTSEAHAAVNGQTLSEEKSAQGNFEWSDNFNKKIRIAEPDKWIPFTNNKIYGGQQFERLLAEFKAVCDSVELPSPSSDDIATSVGTNRVNNAPNLIWVASDYAQHQSSELLKPLIDQLLKRAVYILRRLVEVAERVVLHEHKRHRSADMTTNMTHYPHFTNYTRDNYYKFIDRLAQQCRVKCLDEFYSTRTIYYEVSEYATDKLKAEPKSDELKAATKLANDVLKVVLTRVSKNLLLKCYQCLLDPLQTALLADLQHQLHALREEEMDQLFQVTAVKERLKSEEHTHEKALAACGEWMRHLTAVSEQLNAPPKQDKS